MRFFLYLLILSGILTGCKDAEKEKTVYNSETLLINQISVHVYQHISFLDTKEWGKVPCNGMIVAYKNEVVIFDTPPDNETSRELIEWTTKYLGKIIAVIPTHYHIDNLGGLDEFHRQGIASYAYNKTIQITKEKGLSVPQRGFDKNMELEVGNEKVHIEFFGEGHTCDNIVGYFPLEDIMFGGCLIKEMGAGKGNLAEANVGEWSETVKKVKMKYPKVKKIIAGHGKLGGLELLDYMIKLFE
jgi:metallo-beta-lactamase class B